jgi:DNA-binding NarL/FixJ family response regulator
LDGASLARRRLVIALEAHPGVEVVFDGPEPGGLFDRLTAIAPDVVVVAVAEGLAATVERVGWTLPSARVLALVDNESDEAIDWVIANGATGVLSRRVDVPEVAAAVADVAAGRPVLDACAAAVLARRLRDAGPAVNGEALEALDLWAAMTGGGARPTPLEPGASRQLAQAMARIRRTTRHAGLRAPEGR